MRKSFVALLLLLGAAASMATLAFAQTSDYAGNVGEKLVNLRSAKERITRAARVSPARAEAVSDSIWIGHSSQVQNNADPSTYSYGPFHIGRGLNKPSAAASNTSPNNAGVWDWDRFQADESDSLQGWWPMRRAYSRTDGPTNDVARTWLANEMGNQGCYVQNSKGSRKGYVNPNAFLGNGKANFGVLGYWHQDPGSSQAAYSDGVNRIAGTTPIVPSWAPLNGAGSAWCGIRGHGDLVALDPQTNNPFNLSLLEMQGESGGTLTTGSFKTFPGYPGQMDQLLYTDVNVSNPASSLDLSFLYRTALSTSANATASSRRGWYQFDTKKAGAVVAGGTGMDGAPNYISNSGIGQPADSFMVYIGVPVDINNVNLSDGTVTKVYDLKRRWLSEVIRLEKPIVELPSTVGDGRFHKSGLNTGSYNTNPGSGATDGLTGSISLANFYDAGLGGTQRVRIVFRVHTNLSFDDNNGTSFSSGGVGAAIVDDVSLTVTPGATLSYNFDGAGQIDNGNATDDATVGSFRATGKPPSLYFHAHALAGDPRPGYGTLPWADLCGPITAGARFCNMTGVVISVGNHDNSEGPGGNSTDPADYSGVQTGMKSPTVNLMNTGIGAFNAMGIDGKAATASDDYYVWYDIYTGIYDLFNNGDAWTFAFQSYPAVSPNGSKQWGEMRAPGFQIFNPDDQCLPDIEPARFNNLIATTNPNLVPDSLRIYLGNNQQCYRFAAVTACPNLEGGYFDNISLGLMSSQSGGTAAVALDIWMFINDAFPTNDNSSPDPNVATAPGTARFDTCGANLTIGLNNSRLTGDATRLTIPGDTTVVIGSVTGSSTKKGRVDMVFRVKPGVGNYVTVGDPTSGLRKIPTSTTAAVSGVYVGSGSQNFWAAYLASPGEMSKGVHGPGNFWNRNVWNSARLDSADVNIWPVTSNANVFNLDRAFGSASLFMGAYHEDDPKYGLIGIDHPICYLVNPAGAVNSTNIDCSGIPPAIYGVVPGTTKEGSKVIPDGLLTPGAHVEYFFRGQTDGGTGSLARNDVGFVMCPETTFVTPQNTEGSSDGHRWQEFSVLPDRWKDPLLGDRDDNGQPYGGSMACMLYVDENDRRGNERAWVSVADSMGATSAAKRGGHNGWRSNGGATALIDGVGNALDISTNPAIARYTHGGSAGSTWDMYGVKASESLTTSAGSLGGRLGPQGTNLETGKDGKNAPTAEMLKTYYKVLLILSGDLNSGVLGPFGDRGANDLALLNDFMLVGFGSPAEKKAVLIGGDGFVESETNSAGHDVWLADRFGVALQDPSYKLWSGNGAQYADLITAGPIAGEVYSVGNSCLWTDDVLNVVANSTNPQVSAYYQNVGANGPYVAGVYTPIQTGKFYESFVDGWDLEHLYTYSTFTSGGRLGYYVKVFNQVAATTGLCQIQGTPLVDVTAVAAGQQFVDFMQVRNNIMRSGNARVHFALGKADKVTIRVLDVTGRLVRTLADRNFPAGEHDLDWDGTDNGGNLQPRGVYFTQMKYGSGFTDVKRVIVLKD